MASPPIYICIQSTKGHALGDEYGMTAAQSSSPPRQSTHSYLWLAFLLLLSTTLSLVWSHTRLMWNDEFLSFYTDSVATFHQVILVQLHHPISLDPPTYHLLSHLCMDILGRKAIALRLPALAGFLLFQLCLFFFVRRIAGDRSAIIAAAIPTLTASFHYSVEARPYGLLLGFYALSLLCWQIATQFDDSPANTSHPSRLLPLIGLALSIALAITSHYFGVLILIPVSLGELSRILIRKRIDFGVLTALILGLASVGLILPFKRALMAYQQHYYTGVTVEKIAESYRGLVYRYTWSDSAQKLTHYLLLIVALVLLFEGYQRFKRRPAAEHAYTWIALAAMALLPFFGYLFGRFVTHTLEVRFVMATLVALTAIFAIVLERRLRSNAVYVTLLGALLIAAVILNSWDILQERRASNQILAGFQLSPKASAELHQNPKEPIYVQSSFAFFLDTYYNPDPTLRPRLTLLYGEPQEMRWIHNDTAAITAINLRTFEPFPTLSYDDFRRQPSPLLILYQHPVLLQWISEQLAADHISDTPIDECFLGELVRVNNPPNPQK